MKKLFYFSLLCIILLLPSFLSASNDSSEFESWIINKDFFPDPSHVERAKQYHYFFVTGFLSEVLQWSFVEYYYDPIKELNHRGIPESNIHRPIYLSSSSAAEENAEGLLSILLEQAPGERKDLVLVGHSMGAQELFLISLKHPDFIKKRVHAIFLLQGSIGGSPIADYLAGESGAETLDKLSWAEWLLFRSFMAKGSRLREMVENGLHSLTRKNAKALWSDMEIPEEEKNILKKRLFYICSKIRPSEISGLLSPLFSVLGQYLWLNFGDNDGLVLLEDQYTDRFGTRLAVLTADHSDLVLRTNAATRRMRKGLARAIIQWVGRGDEEPEKLPGPY